MIEAKFKEKAILKLYEKYPELIEHFKPQIKKENIKEFDKYLFKIQDHIQDKI